MSNTARSKSKARFQPKVVVCMGSQSDWETMQEAANSLKALAVPHDVRIISAHRTPDRLAEFARGAAAAGVSVIIAGAGGAAHLPGMLCLLYTSDAADE